MNMVLGPNEETVLGLKEGQTFPNHVSSMSLFYEDVYDRYYRTRIVYKAGSMDTYEIIGKELWDHSELDHIPPFFGWKVATDYSSIERYFQQPEGTSKTVPYDKDKTTAWHFIKRVTEVKNQPITGIAFTGNKPIRILELSMSGHHGLPAWKLQIGNYKAFNLEKNYELTPVLQPSHVSYTEFGLEPTSDTPEGVSLQGLYDHILDETERHLQQLDQVIH
ncbi:hypothetical protein LLE49_27865 [Alicyclobacillus tolerans]|uniref:hypothetical protein n=1 Tax=Alicyclobacillus tolerans TaxID=90970 RepID=UPI001F39984B|nr:hypothetical protein [Alicyclobacillus tolerans]MCF8568540.1 hypothetical protein [Alicyclobacillus tolerans]